MVQKQNREIERLLKDARQASRFKSEFLANMKDYEIPHADEQDFWA